MFECNENVQKCWKNISFVTLLLSGLRGVIKLKLIECSVQLEKLWSYPTIRYPPDANYGVLRCSCTLWKRRTQFPSKELRIFSLAGPLDKEKCTIFRWTDQRECPELTEQPHTFLDLSPQINRNYPWVFYCRWTHVKCRRLEIVSESHDIDCNCRLTKKKNSISFGFPNAKDEELLIVYYWG